MGVASLKLQGRPLRIEGARIPALKAPQVVVVAAVVAFFQGVQVRLEVHIGQFAGGSSWNGARLLLFYEVPVLSCAHLEPRHSSEVAVER